MAVMSPSSSPPSANGSLLKSRSPPPSGPRLQPPSEKPPRSKPGSANIQTPKATYSFAKITIVVFIIAVADVVFVWHSIHASLGGEGDEPHHAGAEAGLHHLHENKRRKQLHEHVRQIHNVTKSVDANNFVPHQIDERIAKILKSANVEVDDEETISQLPSWDDVVAMYGEKPIIYGLETCEPYREKVKPEDRMVGPAGIFNTGTNLLFQLVKENCDIKEAQHSTTHKEPKRNGVRWQAPWGKHNPPSTHRGKNVAKMWGRNDDGKEIIQENFFPVVMIKDLYSWMGSQCRHHYSAFWDHGLSSSWKSMGRGKGDGNCPNLVKKTVTDHDELNEVETKYAKGWETYESLVDMWNRWYLEYEEQQFPHLTTRFEDLLFHGEEVTKIVCKCVGGVSKKRFKYIEDSAKENGMPIHNGANGLVKALLQYANPTKRLAGLTDRDRWYASRAVSAELMTKYGYVAPPLPT